MQISREELTEYLNEHLVDGGEAARLLGCSRQNILDLVKRGKLVPVYETSRVRFFLKEDVLARK